MHHHFLRKTSSITLSVLLTVAIATAQNNGLSGSATTQPPVGAVEAPKTILDKFNLHRGTLQDLILPNTVAQSFSVSVSLGGKRYTVNLQPNDVRTKNFKVYAADANGMRELPKPPSTTYRGVVQSHPNSIVAGSLFNGQLSAMVHFAHTTWTVQPLNEVVKSMPHTTHIVYRGTDLRELKNVKCGVDDHGHKHNGGQGNSGPMAVCKQAELAIDADNEYYKKNGSNNSQVQAAVTKLINGVNVIYKRDVEIEHKISQIIIRTSPVYTGTDLRSLLTQFRSRWQSSHGNVKRDTAHLMTGRGSFSGIIGIAYLSAICSTSIGYGASKAYHSSLATNVGLVAHELGHNWGSNHCSGSACYIMCASLGGCGRNLTQFGTSSKSVITNYKNSRSCLSACGGGGGTPGTYTSYGAGCKGTGGSGGGGKCHAQNMGCASGRNGGNTNVFATPFKVASATVSTGARIRTQNAGKFNVEIWRTDAAGKPTSKLSGTGSITVGAGYATYSGNFPTPVPLAAGNYALVHNRVSGNSSHPICPSGTPTTHYWHPPSTPTWRGPYTSVSWAYEVICSGGGGGGKAVPALGNTGTPNLGKSFKLNISQAKKNSKAFVLFGPSTSSISLSPLGAPGCTVVATPGGFVASVSINANGSGSLSVNVPNNKSLLKKSFYNQGIVLDSGANRLGVALTAGGRGTVGDQ